MREERQGLLSALTSWRMNLVSGTNVCCVHGLYRYLETSRKEGGLKGRAVFWYALGRNKCKKGGKENREGGRRGGRGRGKGGEDREEKRGKREGEGGEEGRKEGRREGKKERKLTSGNKCTSFPR